MGGKEAVKAAQDAGWSDIKAIAISGVQGDGTAMARLSGYEKGVTEAGGEFLKGEIQYADAVADKAANCMEAVMQNHPEGIAIIVLQQRRYGNGSSSRSKGATQLREDHLRWLRRHPVRMQSYPG